MDGSVARPRPLLALGVRLLTAGTLATMAMLVKLAGDQGVHLAELIFWRQAIMAVCVIALLAVWGKLATVKTKRLNAHMRRALYGITGMFFVYGAVMLLPLPEATAISFTAPFFAVMISVLFFGESVGKYRWGAVVLGFAGVLLITQPSFLGGNSDLVDPVGAAIGLIAAMLVSLISFQVQDLNKTEQPWSIVFWFAALTTPLTLIAMPFVYQPHSQETWLIIVAMALCGALGQILLTTSLRFGSAAVILLMDYTSLLWATWYGYTVFDQSPGTGLWLGAPLIIGAGVLIAWRERQLARNKAQPIAD
ncbi:DMT family transporter [Erythrobacter insulae]|uniref:DMT family transporter n=1 Tax=Erythrobacter insulae TaxID=2584124 RepID=A0A547P8Z4_9SPHN|nr:DMT family transporter [Erythrobacter insulae]TRD10606.1 DMT family transporter [Erythrobacter insulae]